MPWEKCLSHQTQEIPADLHPEALDHTSDAPPFADDAIHQDDGTSVQMSAFSYEEKYQEPPSNEEVVPTALEKSREITREIDNHSEVSEIGDEPHLACRLTTIG